MNREAIIRNAEGNIKHQEALAKSGKDFSAGEIIKAERLNKLAQQIDFTEEEREMLADLYKWPNADWSKAKDIKEKYGLSWNELKMLAGACTALSKIREIRNRSGLSRQEFAKKYSIPIRTLEKWEREETKPAEYIVKLLERVVCEDFIDTTDGK